MADEFVTYKDLLKIVNKIDETSKKDRHELATQITTFMSNISDEFDELKDWLANVKVLEEKVNNMDRHIKQVEKDSNANKKEIEWINKKIYIATWTVWAVAAAWPELISFLSK